MTNLIYKIKNRLFRYSDEEKKTIRPTYNELIRYEKFQKKTHNKLVLGFAAGRSGQNWFTKIFNSHPNWIGTSERFEDFEAFFRYISYYNLAVDKKGFFKLFKLASNRDLAIYQNTFIASPYFCFGVEEITKILNPDYIFFNIRNPINSVESFFMKNWYNNTYNFQDSSPLIDISTSQYRSFSRIVPTKDYFEEWLKLSRIGKITWYWATANKAIYDDFNKIKHIEKFFVKLEDIDKNYNLYEKLAIKFNFKNKMNKKKFHNVINKASNKGLLNKYKYKDWSDLEKKEFEILIDRIFPNYEKIKTNIY